MIKENLNIFREYAHHIRRYVWISVILFLLFAGAGFYATQYYPQEIQGYLDEAQTFFESMQAPTQWDTFLMIFKNNAEAMLMVVGMGIFLGLFSLTFLAANGFILGIYAYLFYSQGIANIFVAGILPHGIIELPCMFFAAAIGLKIGTTVLRRLAGKKVSVTSELARGIEFAVLVIVPALAVAAFIETCVTPFFIALAQGGGR